MSDIRPLSDFNRNQAAIIDTLAQTGEPLYLMRNGSACAVVMDVATFDKAMSLRNDPREQEIRTYRNILKGVQEFAAGDYIDADDANRLIREEKGWL